MLILNYLTQLEYLPRKVKDKHFKFVVDYLLLFKTYFSLTTKHLTIFLTARVAPIISGGHSGPKSWCTVP